jgi:hypothetical protein
VHRHFALAGKRGARAPGRAGRDVRAVAEVRRRLFGSPEPAELAVEALLAAEAMHAEAVQRYFASAAEPGAPRLLLLVIDGSEGGTGGGSMAELCRFLQLPVPALAGADQLPLPRPLPHIKANDEASSRQAWQRACFCHRMCSHRSPMGGTAGYVNQLTGGEDLSIRCRYLVLVWASGALDEDSLVGADARASGDAGAASSECAAGQWYVQLASILSMIGTV